jgi:hypothetical protein
MAKRQQRSTALSAPAARKGARPSVGVSFEIVRQFAHRLPAVEDGTSYGTPALKVRGKLFARLHQDGTSLVLRADSLDRQILLQADPTTFYITDHYRNYPWILIRLARISRKSLPDLLERAWRYVAPARLVAEHLHKDAD